MKAATIHKRPAAPRRSLLAHTLAEMMVAIGVFSFTVLGLISLHLFGLRRGAIGCLHNYRASTGEAALLAGELAGLLAAESAAVEGRKLYISSREVAIPSLVGDWETTHWPATVGADLHA